MKPTILADTSLLIDFFRKKNKSVIPYFALQRQFDMTISTITVVEFKISALQEAQHQEYNLFLQTLSVLPFTDSCAEEAIIIYQQLKRRNARIGLADTLIAATAIAEGISLATLNTEHFARIASLNLVPIPTFA